MHRRTFLATALATMALALTTGPGPRAANVRILEGVVNLNTASPDELQLLSGIGPAKVRNVIAYRHAHPFRTVDELVRIKGIGRKMVRRLRMHLAVSGPSTAQQVIRPAPARQVITAGTPPPMLAANPAAANFSVVAPPRRVAASARRVLPGIVFPTNGANHCSRGP